MFLHNENLEAFEFMLWIPQQQKANAGYVRLQLSRITDIDWDDFSSTGL